jgi:hypothetical protein
MGHLQNRKLSGDWKEITTGQGGTWTGSVDESNMGWENSPDMAPLYEYRSADGSRIYSTESQMPNKQMQRMTDPLCRVWRNPASLLILDRDAKPAPE